MTTGTLWNYCRGYVKIKIEGLYLERLLNALSEYGISLWGMDRCSRICLTACIGKRDWKKLQASGLLQGYRAKVLGTCGLPAKLANLRSRKALIFGAIAAAVLFVVMTSFVWFIEIEGDPAVESETILQQLEEMGVKKGMLTAQIDVEDIEYELLRNNPAVAWVDVRLRGVKLNIEIKEQEPAPELLSEEPADIVAQKDGVISSIVVLEGTAMVKEGQAVKAGDVLISGNIVKEGIAPQTVHARGEVKASVFYSEQAEVELFEEIRTPTGNSVSVRTLKMGNWEIPLEQEEMNFQNYDIVTEEQNICDIFFPVKIVTTRYDEVDVEKKELDLDALKEDVKQIAYEKIVSNLPKDVMINKVEASYKIVEETKLRASVLVETTEYIGEQQALTPMETEAPQP